jgi:hypothetical protein
VSFNTFPVIGTGGSDLSSRTTFKYPKDVYTDPDVVTTFEDQLSVEVQSSGATGFWSNLQVLIQAPEADADKIFTFLKGQRLRAIPFNFVHRKRGTILVRYWSNELPYVRAVSGNPDLVEFDLPLRQEGGA